MKDFQLALRRLKKNPLQLAAGLLAFTLGIGINTALFSICDAIMFHPIELRGLDRLAVFTSFSRGDDIGIYDVSPADFLEFQAGAKSFEAIGFSQNWDATITRDGEPEQVLSARVSANWLEVVGSTMVTGRGFIAGEDQPGRNRVVVISHGLWTRRYGADPQLIGRKILLNQEEYEVVGVLKQTTRFPAYVQIFTPLPRTQEFEQRRADFHLMVAARLKEGVTFESAAAELATLQAGIVARNKLTHDGRGVSVVPLRERVTGGNDIAKRYVWLLLFGSGFALLIACANVANLQLARVTGRSREFAIQSALGASRWAIARQVLFESFLLSMGGSLLGGLASVWFVDFLKRLLPADTWQFIPMWPYMQVNTLAMLVTGALSFAAALIAGVAPALHSIRNNAQESLRDGGRAMTSGAQRQWLRGMLVAFQMMLALVLLIGAGLMVRSSHSYLERFYDKSPERVATMQLILPGTKYDTRTKRIDFSRRLDEELKRLPGNEIHGIVNTIPLSDSGASNAVLVEGRPEPPPAERMRALNLAVSPGYFSLMRIPLRKGRFLETTDNEERDPVCVVDETFAEALFRGEDPIGHRIAPVFGDTRRYCRIVGVVGAQLHFAWENGVRKTFYRPMAQVDTRVISIMVRTQGPVLTMLEAARRAVQTVDPDQPVRQAFSYSDLIGNTLAGLRMMAIMMSGIGIIALVLACLGTYSVMSYTVSERTGEIGMRMAMGAQRLDILGLIGRQALWMCGGGIALGLVLGYWLAQFFKGLIFGITAGDFWNLSSVSLLLAAVAALAMYIPARRAMRMDPADALRHD